MVGHYGSSNTISNEINMYIYQIIYLVGKTKFNNAEYRAEIEAENAYHALKSFRAEYPEAKIFTCVQKET